MKNQKGFTLIELMIVVAIIGILTAIVVPNFQDYKDKHNGIRPKYIVMETIRIGLNNQFQKICWDGKVYLLDSDGEMDQVMDTDNSGNSFPEKCEMLSSITNPVLTEKIVTEEVVRESPKIQVSADVVNPDGSISYK